MSQPFNFEQALKDLQSGKELTLPIRLVPKTTTCRVHPFS